MRRRAGRIASKVVSMQCAMNSSCPTCRGVLRVRALLRVSVRPDGKFVGGRTVGRSPSHMKKWFEDFGEVSRMSVIAANIWGKQRTSQSRRSAGKWCAILTVFSDDVRNLWKKARIGLAVTPRPLRASDQRRVKPLKRSFDFALRQDTRGG